MPPSRVVRRLITLGALSGVTLLAGASPAGAEGDLRIEADAVYELNPEESRLEVTVEFVLTNQKPSTTSGYIITQYYFDSYSVVLPDEAVDVVARDGRGRILDVTDAVEELDEDGTMGRVLTMEFPRPVFYRGAQEIVLTFHLPGGEPRSESMVRANPAYAAFAAWAWGDAGLSDVTIRIPPEYEVNYGGDDLESAEGEDFTTWFQTEVDNPDEWGVFFTARYDDALLSEVVEVEGLTITVRSWPGDDMWATRVADVVRRGLPALQEAVGLDFGDQTTLEMLEALDPSLLGYAGWYLSDEDVIEMGEDLDDHIILHEISHLWFNEDLFTERWITEGLAEEFAAHVVEGIDGEADPELGRANRPFPFPPISVPLNRWELPFTPPSEDDDVAKREDYGYNASFWMVRTLREEIGEEAMRAVLSAAAADLAAYQDGTNPETVSPTDGWWRFLDLLEEVGGSQRATSLFREFVVSSEDLTLLDDRTEAREAYAALVAADTEWETPWLVRRLMGDWEFPVAAERIDVAMDVVGLRDQVATTAANLALDPPDELELAYEGAAEPVDLDTAITIGETQLDSVNAVTAARTAVDASRGFFDNIGLIGENPETEYQEAADAFEASRHNDAEAEAAEVVAMIDNAGGVGTGRVLRTAGVLVLLGGGITGFVLWKKRRVAVVEVPTDDVA